MNHSDVVTLIQGLPVDFRLVVARNRDSADEEVIAAETGMEVESQPNETEREGIRWKENLIKANYSVRLNRGFCIAPAA